MQIPGKLVPRWIAPTLLALATPAIAAAALSADQPQQQAEQIDEKIARLIEQLGDEDYFVRQRAQTELSKFSFEAFDALSAATTHPDLEIAARARYLLRLMRVEWTVKDDPPEVKRLLADYEVQNDSTKRTRMRSLTGLPDLRGIPALCRLVRYEKSSELSKTAAIGVLDLQPHDEPPTKELAEKLRKHLSGSRRTAATWLLTWLRFRDDPEAALVDWAKLVEAEHSLLEHPPADTSSQIVAKLVRLQIEWLKRLEQSDNALAAMHRLVELERGDPETLAELLDWLIRQRAWGVADELAAKFADQFAGNPMLLYTLAQAQAEQGDQQRAEQTAQRALKLNPDNNIQQLAKHYSTARALRARGLLNWARQEYCQVIETGTPGNAVVEATMTELFNWLVAQQAWKETNELAARFAPRFPDNALLLYTQAQAQAEGGDRQQAEQTAARALKLDPGSDAAQVDKHRTTARLLQYRRLFEWAEREYRHVIDLGHDDAETLAGLLECLVVQKSWKAVDELALRFPLRFAGDATLLYTQAQAQAEQGNHQPAEQLAEKAWKLDPGNDPDLLNKHRLVAGMLADRGRFEWARREYRHVIDSGAPDDVITLAAQSRLSEMLHDQGKDLEAAEVSQGLVKAFEDNLDVEDELGLKGAAIRSRMEYFFACHWKSVKDPAKHREYLDKALEADETDLDVLIACHRLPGQTPEYREKIGRLVKKATEDLRKEIAEEPTSSTPYNQFAWLVGNTEGDLDEALKCSQRSLQLRPHSGGYYDTLAHVYFARGDYENAVKTQTKAAELEPYSGLIARQLEVFRKKWEETNKQKEQ